MLSYTTPRKRQPMALWEQVKQGQDIGLDISKDRICMACWRESQYVKLAYDGINFVCAEHGIVQHTLPEYVVETDHRFRGHYESKLLERRKMTNAVVTTNQTSALMVEQNELTRMKQMVRAGMLGVKDLGEHTDAVVAMVAHGALVHGLNPMTGEIFPYVERDKDITNPDGSKTPGRILNVTLGINYKGLARSARRQSDFHVPRTEIRKLSSEEIRDRRLHIVPNWAWFRDKSKPQFVEHPPEQCIAVEVQLYRLDVYEKVLTMAERAKKLGVKPIPVTSQTSAIGVWRPGDTIPSGRTAEWRAEIRAIKQAITQAYDLSFAMQQMIIDKADVNDVPVVVERDESDDIASGFSVEDVLAEQPDLVSEGDFTVMNVWPGVLLDAGKQKWLNKQLASNGISPVTPWIQQVLGEDETIDRMTDVTGRNLIECAKRLRLFKGGEVTPAQLGVDAALADEAIPAFLEQMCFKLCKSGASFQPLEGGL